MGNFAALMSQLSGVMAGFGFTILLFLASPIVSVSSPFGSSRIARAAAHLFSSAVAFILLAVAFAAFSEGNGSLLVLALGVFVAAAQLFLYAIVAILIAVDAELFKEVATLAAGAMAFGLPLLFAMVITQWLQEQNWIAAYYYFLFGVTWVAFIFLQRRATPPPRWVNVASWPIDFLWRALVRRRAGFWDRVVLTGVPLLAAVTPLSNQRDPVPSLESMLWPVLSLLLGIFLLDRQRAAGLPDRPLQ